MKIVAEAMNRTVFTIEAGSSLGEAVGVLQRSGAEHLLVVEGESLVGILCGCELRGARLEGLVSERRLLSVPTIRPDARLEEAAATMAECEVGFLPVTVGGLLLGTLSEAELADAGIERPPVRNHGHPHRHRRHRRPLRG